jgi:dTDP-4-amino-4,6-dideoxygalactose transaminase
MPETSFIPFYAPSLGEEEIREVEATLRSGWLTSGPRAAQFEQEFGAYVGAAHALAVSSGTAGLHLALAGLGIGPGDEVVTSPLTFCSTVHTILQTGAVPVLADIGPDGNIDPDAIGKRITESTRAIIPVHFAGLPCKMRAIRALARRHGIYVIEDAAHAAGAHYEGRPIGAAPAADGPDVSDAVVFSFCATNGEGGMVTTYREPLAKKLRTLSLHGLSKESWNSSNEWGDWCREVVAAGFKYNLSDILAAIGIHQLRKLEQFIEIRTRYAQIYNQALGDLDEVELPPDNPRSRHAWDLYVLRLNLAKLKIDRRAFLQELRRRQIGASVHFIPIPLHPYFAQLHLARCRCPRALELYPRLVSLPLYPAMTEDQVHYVAQSVREALQAGRRQAFAMGGAQPLS